MPDKPLTIATYAAGASLAAITLVYVFAPTFFLDEETSSSNRKKGVVGLSNPANDCFINSILQAMAGLPDLRLYLIREMHRRKLDGPDVYRVDPDAPDEEAVKKGVKLWKLEGLQQGMVTQALKDVLDRLNERPIFKKVISAQAFVSVLEHAFRTRISRQQQDAQEFLQIVTERLCDEYHAGQRSRKRSKGLRIAVPTIGETALKESLQEATEKTAEDPYGAPEELDDDYAEDGFPFEGKMESQIQCLTCSFKPKPSESTFVTLTLNVPQRSSTTLNACFDGMLKVEHIDDFKCDYCRLEHAIEWKRRQLAKAVTSDDKKRLEVEIEKLQKAIEEDPENPPKDVELPDLKLAPKRRIARHMRISSFPKILAIHLSRSIFTATTLSTKNMAKVNFPESLPLGGLLDQRKYRLLCTVTHKGGHNSGHYESFRRQVSALPYSTPTNFGAEGAFSRAASPNPSAIQSPRLSSANLPESLETSTIRLVDGATDSPPATASPSTTSMSSQSSLSSRPYKQERPPTSAPRQDSLQPPISSPSSAKPFSISPRAPSIAEAVKARRKTRKRDNRWWRISDEKIKECRTSDVLGMQKEVYLLFYELDRRDDDY